jgi:drug/metabolite transporter (DMT)-like permease
VDARAAGVDGRRFQPFPRRRPGDAAEERDPSHAALVLAAASSGLSTVTTKYALAGFPPTSLLVAELGVATVVLWSLPRVRRCSGRAFRRSYLLLGLLEPGIAYALFNFGLERTSAAEGSLLVSLESVVVLLFAAVFLGERLGRELALGVTLGVAGTALLALSEAHRGRSLTGDVLVLLGVVVAAAYSVAARRVAPVGEAAVVTAYQLVGGLALAAVAWSLVSALGGRAFEHASWSQWLAALATGVLGSAIPFVLFTFAVARLPAARTGMFLNLIPVFGVLASVGLLDEQLMVQQLAGATLVVAGLVAAQRRVRRRPGSGAASARASTCGG